MIMTINSEQHNELGEGSTPFDKLRTRLSKTDTPARKCPTTNTKQRIAIDLTDEAVLELVQRALNQNSVSSKSSVETDHGFPSPNLSTTSERKTIEKTKYPLEKTKYPLPSSSSHGSSSRKRRDALYNRQTGRRRQSSASKINPKESTESSQLPPPPPASTPPSGSRSPRERQRSTSRDRSTSRRPRSKSLAPEVAASGETSSEVKEVQPLRRGRRSESVSRGSMRHSSSGNRARSQSVSKRSYLSDRSKDSGAGKEVANSSRERRSSMQHNNKVSHTRENSSKNLGKSSHHGSSRGRTSSTIESKATQDQDSQQRRSRSKSRSKSVERATGLPRPDRPERRARKSDYLEAKLKNLQTPSPSSSHADVFSEERRVKSAQALGDLSSISSNPLSHSITLDKSDKRRSAGGSLSRSEHISTSPQKRVHSLSSHSRCQQSPMPLKSEHGRATKGDDSAFSVLKVSPLKTSTGGSKWLELKKRATNTGGSSSGEGRWDPSESSSDVAPKSMRHIVTPQQTQKGRVKVPSKSNQAQVKDQPKPRSTIEMNFLQESLVWNDWNPE